MSIGDIVLYNGKLVKILAKGDCGELSDVAIVERVKNRQKIICNLSSLKARGKRNGQEKAN